MKEKKNNVKSIIIGVLVVAIITLITCTGCDKKITNIDNEKTSINNVVQNTTNTNNTDNNKNDLDVLKSILKQQAFGNFEQSVENYFEGYLGPVIETLIKDSNGSTSIENLKIESLNEEDIAKIICLTTDYKGTSIHSHYEGQEKINFQKNEVSEIVKKYFNANNYSFSKFTKLKEYEWSDSSITLGNDGTLICVKRYAGRTYEVTDVIYDSTSQKVLVYIDAINPGQAGASNIDFTGTVELRYNENNFNVISLNFKNITN